MDVDFVRSDDSYDDLPPIIKGSAKGWGRNPDRSRAANTCKELCDSVLGLEEEYTFLAQRKRIKGAVTFWGTLLFAIAFLLMSTMALPLLGSSADGAGDNILYNIGKALYGAFFPVDRHWIVGALLSALVLYGIPFILTAVVRGIANSLPESASGMEAHGRYYDDPFRFTKRALVDLGGKNDALAFKLFAGPVEWCIGIVAVVAGVLGFRWVLGDALMDPFYEAMPLSAIAAVLGFRLLCLPVRWICYLQYGGGFKRRKKLYSESMEYIVVEEDREKRKAQLEKLLKQAEKDRAFPIIALIGQLAPPQNMLPWLEMVDKYPYFAKSYSEGVKLMREAYNHYAREYPKMKRAADEAKATENLMAQIRHNQNDKGTKTFLTDTRNGGDIYYKDGQYVNEKGERVPIQWLSE